MATVREKAAALSLGAVCSPAARPPGTGRGKEGSGTAAGGERAAGAVPSARARRGTAGEGRGGEVK